MISSLRHFLICAPVAVLGTQCLLVAQPLAVSTEYWKDPSFIASFNGSYRINARIEPTVSSEHRALLVQIQNLMKKGQRESALDVLTSSPLTNSSAALLYNRGNIQLELGSTDDAIKSYELALKKFPSFRRAHKNLGAALIQKGEYEKAETALREAVQLGELDGSTLGLLGYCYLQAEQYASALQAYRMAQLTQPTVIDWKAGMAQCLAEVGQDEEALKLLEEVVEIRPQEVSYQLLLVNTQLKIDRNMDAIAGLELLRKQGLLETENLSLLANLYLREDDLRMAKPVIAEMQSTLDSKNVASFLQTVSAVVSLADWEYAMSLLEAVNSVEKELSQENFTKRFTAFIKIQKGESGAEELLESIVDSDPLDGEALLMLAGVKVSQKDYEHAALLFERAEKVQATQYRALLEHGKMLVGQKRYKAAHKMLRNALELKPSSDLERYVSAVDSLAQSF